MRSIILAISFFLTSFIGLAAVPVSAQVSQQDINQNLCSGASLDFTGNSGGSCTGGDASATVTNLIHNVVNILSLIVGVVAVIMIIVGGLRYITSGGNDASVTGAKNTILYAIVGLVIVALAQVIVHFVLSRISTSG